MSYIIYKSIREKEFDVLKEGLNNIERVASPLMQMHNFYLNRRDYRDVLALDYLQNGEKFFGNIGINFIDKEMTNNVNFFEFYITKSFDKENVRFYKKVVFEKKYTLDEININIYKLLDDCLLIYSSMKQEELVDNVKLKK